MQITRGKIVTGLRFAVYGSEGIGKSTFVSQIPGVVFIDTEGSTNNMDVQRYPKPTSWQMLMNEVDDAIRNSGMLNALVIDTADWAERLCLDHVCASNLINGKPAGSIEDYGYGRGYTYLYEEFGKLLDKLTELHNKGVHVGFTAHAMMRKFEQPDELGTYDRWEMKTSKKVAPLIKEWCDLLLFANYKTFVYAADKDGKKHKASGAQRVMYTTHHACWDAKNRHGLPPEMPFEFAQVAALFQPVGGAVPPPMHAEEQLPIPPAVQNAPAQTPPPMPQAGPSTPPPAPAPAPAPAPQQAPAQSIDYSMVPPALADLMRADGITPFEVQAAVAQKGYFPMDTPWPNYPKDFVDGVLIGAWPQVKNMVLANREEAPF
jgi:hypothetical protein